MSNQRHRCDPGSPGSSRRTRRYAELLVLASVALAGSPAAAQEGLIVTVEGEILPPDFHVGRASAEELMEVGSRNALARAVVIEELHNDGNCTDEAIEWVRGGPTSIENSLPNINAMRSASSYLSSCGVEDRDLTEGLREMMEAGYSEFVPPVGVRSLCALGAEDPSVLDLIRNELRSRAETDTSSYSMVWVPGVIGLCDLGRETDALLATVVERGDLIVWQSVVGAVVIRQDPSLEIYIEQLGPEVGGEPFLEFIRSYVEERRARGEFAFVPVRPGPVGAVEGSGDSPADGPGEAPSAPNPDPSPLDEQPR